MLTNTAVALKPNFMSFLLLFSVYIPLNGTAIKKYHFLRLPKEPGGNFSNH